MFCDFICLYVVQIHSQLKSCLTFIKDEAQNWSYEKHWGETIPETVFQGQGHFSHRKLPTSIQLSLAVPSHSRQLPLQVPWKKEDLLPRDPEALRSEKARRSLLSVLITQKVSTWRISCGIGLFWRPLWTSLFPLHQKNSFCILLFSACLWNFFYQFAFLNLWILITFSTSL